MKRLLPAILLAFALLFLNLAAYGQIGPTSNSAGPLNGAYDPHPGQTGMNAPPPIAQRPGDYLARDPKFSAKLQKLLPESVTPIQACDGFKTLGDCVAAVYASNNLTIPLPDLKAKSTGKGANLEKGIHELKPEADAKAEKKKAYKQAEKDIPVSN